MSSGQISFAPIFPFWLVLLLLLLGLAAILWQYRHIYRRLGRKRALCLSFLRLGAICSLIVLAVNPTFVERREKKVSPSLAILLDNSRNMGLPGLGQENRLAEAKDYLLGRQKSILQSLAERFDVRLYALGESLKAVKAEDLPTLSPEGRKGNLTEALRKLGGKNSLAVLFSDGNVSWEGNPAMNLPLVTIPLGDPKAYRDIFIKNIKAPAIAFRGREVVIDVAVKSYGFTQAKIPVLLKEGNRLITARSISFKDSPGEGNVSFSLTLEELGEHNLSVSVPPQGGERLTSNNTVSLSLRVLKDKIRILMVSGRPSLNYRFMRFAFKNDPAIDLLSFIILRTPADIMNVPLQEQSLIPFPVDTLFSKELKNFDLLIFDDFSYNLFLRPTHLESIQQFVKEGGGFAAIGGPQFLETNKLLSSPIEDIAPVRLSGREFYRRGSPSGVKLSRAGKAHPITRFSPEESYDVHLWQEMPPLNGINLVDSKGSARVLLESADEFSRPILTVGNYGQGRTLALATDDSWKWYMGMVAQGKGNWAYLRFMERMVRWLTKDPSLDPIQVTWMEGETQLGQPREFRIQLREEELSVRAKGQMKLTVLNPDGLQTDVQFQGGRQSNEYLGSFRPEKEGIYKLKIETQGGFREETLLVTEPLESQDGAPDHEHLRRIAALTGGKMLNKADDPLKIIESFAGKGEKRFFEETKVPLWGSFYGLALILLFLTTEWYFRRRWGLH